MKQKQTASPWYTNPIWVVLLGLALMFGGFQLSNWLPERQGEAARLLAELQQMRGGEHPDLGERIEGLRPTPPFRWPGRILFVIGVGACIAAAALMTRTSANTRSESEDAVAEASGVENPE